MIGKPYGTMTMTIDYSEWKIDVAREAVLDDLGAQSITDEELDAWVDDHALALSEIAKGKIADGEHGSNWVRITSSDLIV